MSELAGSYDSMSSVDSNYTRRGQTESEADIKAGLAAARDLATRKKRIDVDQLSSSLRPRHLILNDTQEEQNRHIGGSKTPLPDMG